MCLASFDGRGFAEHHFRRLWSVSANAYNAYNVYLDQILHTYLL